MKEFEAMLAKIRRGEFSTCYYLWGEEAYFTDQLSLEIQDKALDGIDRSFNQDILYGNEVRSNSLIGLLRSYPVMATRRLVYIRDAHRIPKAETEKLAAYLEKPVPSTILMMVSNDDGKPDSRTKWGKALLTKTEIHEAKRLRENELAKWVEGHARAQKLEIQPDAVALLCEALGNQLGYIENELAKLSLQLQTTSDRRVSRDMIYDRVSIDREYNSFELIEKLSERNLRGALRIVQQMMKNPRENPPIPLLAQLFGFYAQLLSLYGKAANNENEIMKEVGTNFMQARRLKTALSRYPREQTASILHAIQLADARLKGVGTGRMDESHILQTMLLESMSVTA
jgi:DNA polymerase III subunit delta